MCVCEEHKLCKMKVTRKIYKGKLQMSLGTVSPGNGSGSCIGCWGGIGREKQKHVWLYFILVLGKLKSNLMFIKRFKFALILNVVFETEENRHIILNKSKFINILLQILHLLSISTMKSITLLREAERGRLSDQYERQ